MRNLIIKAALASLLVAGVSLSADAQFKGLGDRIKRSAQNAVTNKIERTVDNAVDNAVNNAVGQAKKKVNMEVEYKTQLNAPQLPNAYGIDDLYECLYYWLELQEMANKKKDVEWLTSSKGEQAGLYMQEIANSNSRNNGRWKSYEETLAYYERVSNGTNAILYDGKPDTKGQEGFEKALKWYIDKAKKGKKNAKVYYTLNGCATRNLGLKWDTEFDRGDSKTVQKYTNELIKLWDKLDADTRAKNANSDPNISYNELQAKKVAEQKAAAEKKAREEAEKQAKIEASKVSLKAGSLNKSLNAKALRACKGIDSKYNKVVIPDNSWYYRKNPNGTPKCRTIKVWAVFKNNEGATMATQYLLQQQYMGGGKYSSDLIYYGVPAISSVYVK